MSINGKCIGWQENEYRSVTYVHEFVTPTPVHHAASITSNLCQRLRGTSWMVRKSYALNNLQADKEMTLMQKRTKWTQQWSDRTYETAAKEIGKVKSIPH